MNLIQSSISSLEVSEMVGRNHADVLRDIRKIQDHLAESNFALGEYFTNSTYDDANNQKRPCFLLTKKGCELYGTRMTGEKGTQFAVKYIERFNQMEQHIKAELPSDPVELALQASLKNYQEIKSLQGDVSLLKNSMRIDGAQEFALQSQGKAKVLEVLGGYDSPAYKDLSKKVFQQLWRDFKNYFKLPRYSDLPKSKFDEAVRFISIWQPDTAVRIEIEFTNKQETPGLVK